MKNEMKNKMKKIVAFICVLALSVGAMAAWTPVKEVKATETNELDSVYLPGFRHVTLGNFGMEETTYDSASNTYNLKNIEGAVETDFDNTLISFKAQYNDAYNQGIRIGGNDSYSGFVFRANSAGTQLLILINSQTTRQMVDNGTEAQPSQIGTVYSTDVGEGFNFTDEFVLQISFEYYDKDSTDEDETQDDLKLGVYINGRLVKITTHTSFTAGENDAEGRLLMTTYDKNKWHGAQFGFVNLGTATHNNKEYNKTITLSSVVPEAPGAYLQGFKNVTLNGFGMEEKTYESNSTTYSLKDINGEEVTDLQKTLISAKIKYQDAYNHGIRVGGNNDGSGFLFRAAADGKSLLIIDNNTSSPMVDKGSATSQPYQIATVYSTEVDDVFSFTDEFVLQISFEYYDKDLTDEDETKDDLKLGIYINGKLVNITVHTTNFPDGVVENAHLLMTTHNVKANHGARFGFVNLGTATHNNKEYNKTITLSSVVPENDDLTHITWSDFTTTDAAKTPIPNKAFLKNGMNAYWLSSDVKDADENDVTKLGNTYFEGKVTFLSASDNDVLYFGGRDGWRGLRFRAIHSDTADRLRLLVGNNLIHDFGDNNGAYDMHNTIAGVESFLNEEFTLGVSIEYADYDGDDDENDIQLGIYINGKLYNNTYLYAMDYTTASYNSDELAGNFVGVNSSSTGTGIMLRSVSEVTDKTYNLAEAIEGKIANGIYSAEAIKSDFGTVTKAISGNTEITDFSTGLTVPGDYKLYKENVLIGEVVLHQAEDTHPDKEMDVRDLVAMMKVNANQPLDTWAGTMGAYGADFDEEIIIEKLLSIE